MVIALKFGQQLRTLRKEAGLTQTDLAERIGTVQGYLSRLEQGQAEPCLKTLKALADGLGVSMSELLKGL